MQPIPGHGGAQRVAELGIPQLRLVSPPQRINLLPVSECQRKIGNMTFEVIRLITDDVAIQQNQIEHFAIVKAGNRDHQGSLGIDIPAHWLGPSINTEKRDWGVLHEPVLRAFSGKYKIRIDLIFGCTKLPGHGQISSIDVSWFGVSTVRTKGIFRWTMVANLIEEPSVRAELQHFLKLPGNDVTARGRADVQHRAASIVDARQLGWGGVAIPTRLIRDAIRIGGRVFI